MESDSQPFKVGDIVKRTNGKRKATVESINSRVLVVKWLHTGRLERTWKLGYEKNFGFVKAEGVEAMSNLYEVILEDGTKAIGTKLMEKSKTMWVMEVSGKLVLTDSKMTEEILPYTIEVNVAGKKAHYQVDEGKYSVDDVFIMGQTLQLARVTKVNTKFKGATQEFKPFAKVMVEV